MSRRHRQLHADVAAFRGRGDDLLVDLFEVGAVRGRPRAGLKRRTLTFYEAGSYAMASHHQCFVCGWHFRSRARLAGAHLIAVHATDPRPTSAAVGAICKLCWADQSLSVIEQAATTLLRRVCPGGSFHPSEGTAS
jgi:hypothetical protein